ncbi:MAG: BREX system P-loop protein BrxC [Polyangiaceae bacterium]|nr:BREX system P-loop protein BrxC [Polyangiaceae bacterium]
MKIRELFAGDVTRDIPPVIYFHEQSPAKLATELAEYIVTSRPADAAKSGAEGASTIHDQLVQLLAAVDRELARPSGPELPASWISGYFGSGKSSFAKLLGLALDGVVLPDGRTVGAALIERDQSAARAELVSAWSALTRRIRSIAVVFDIGGAARQDEPIYEAALRQVQRRLGYSNSEMVAEHEHRLERDGLFAAFVEAARHTLGKPWEEAKYDAQAEDHFSHVMHVLQPDRYREPTSFLDSRHAAARAFSSVREAVDTLASMLDHRAAGQTLFIVIDEVSQYLQQDEDRMLKLQSFVSEIGQRLSGRVWLFATGQERLDAVATSNLAKLQDRFPPALRVHLGSANVRDVVHQRLLMKKPAKHGTLRALFKKHRGDVKLYGYGCADITEAQFIDVYPLLPGHVDLLMRITSSLRARRPGADDHAVRGLLQLVAGLFKLDDFADAEVGRLVTLDQVFDLVRAALDPEIHETLGRVFARPETQKDEWSSRVVKAVALLETIQDQLSTTPQLVAQCLYARLGDESALQPVSRALESLRAEGLVTYSEKLGYRIQSAAGRAWQKERDEIDAAEERVGVEIGRALDGIVRNAPDRPRLKGRAFSWDVLLTDRRVSEEKLSDPRDDATIVLDVRLRPRSDARDAASWVRMSAEDTLRHRLVWIVEDDDALGVQARDITRSDAMLERYRPRRASLTDAKKLLVDHEHLHREASQAKLKSTLSAMLLGGTVFFRGQQLRPRAFGADLDTALRAISDELLPDLYPHLTDIVVSSTEVQQLFDERLTGVSTKLTEQGLGILSVDGGTYVASCNGLFPSRIAHEIERRPGLAGQALAAAFSGPPHGYTLDVVKACCAGLLRARRIRIGSAGGSAGAAEVASHVDPGARDLFLRDKEFLRATLHPVVETLVTQRDRIAIRKLFQAHWDLDIEPEDAAIADAVFQSFPRERDRLRALERRVGGLEPVLEKLAEALDRACRSRLVHATVASVKEHLATLREGMSALGAAEAGAAETRAAEPASEPDVVSVDMDLRGREVATREQLRALVQELEDRIGPRLDEGKRVRIS